MASLLVQIKAKMALYAHEKVRGVLEGEYGSVFKGRSMDFDDLPNTYLAMTSKTSTGRRQLVAGQH